MHFRGKLPGSCLFFFCLDLPGRRRTLKPPDVLRLAVARVSGHALRQSLPPGPSSCSLACLVSMSCTSSFGLSSPLVSAVSFGFVQVGSFATWSPLVITQAALLFCQPDSTKASLASTYCVIASNTSQTVSGCFPCPMTSSF